MNPDLIRHVWARAGYRCEYCHVPAAAYPLPFHIDHIIARQHGGETLSGNLALACLHCNRHKGPISPESIPLPAPWPGYFTPEKTIGLLTLNGVATTCMEKPKWGESRS